MGHIIKSTAAVLAVGVLAAGCATRPSQSDMAAADTAIGNAGNAINQAANNPHVEQYASSELGRARDSLRKAEETWKDDHDLAETTHLAYLAQKRAMTAQELANGRAAEEAFKVASAERDRALSVAAAGRASKPSGAPAGHARLALAGFAPGKKEVPATMIPKIDELATMLKNNPERKVVIDGNTDSVGSAGHNKTLAMERAQAVRVALYRRGVDLSRVLIHSSGEDNPVASNATGAGRGENRRVDVMIAESEAMARSLQTSPSDTATGQSGQSGQTGHGGQNGKNGQDKR